MRILYVLIVAALMIFALDLKANQGDLVVCLGFTGESKDRIVEFEAKVIEVSEIGELILEGLTPESLKEKKIAIHPRACAKKDPVRIKGDLYEESKIVYYEDVILEPVVSQERIAEKAQLADIKKREEKEAIKVKKEALKQPIEIKKAVKRKWVTQFNPIAPAPEKTPIERSREVKRTAPRKTRKTVTKDSRETLVMRYLDFLQM